MAVVEARSRIGECGGRGTGELGPAGRVGPGCRPSESHRRSRDGGAAGRPKGPARSFPDSRR